MTSLNNYTDPVLFLYNKYGFDYDRINKIVFGGKYIAILLKNGNIGLCATLNQIDGEIPVNIIDPESIQHRIILNAYYNALLNPENIYKKTVDIFDNIDFTKYSDIVMIGYFESLVTKFNKEKIPLTIFDQQKSDSILQPMSNQMEKISKSDAIILTGTSFFNKTFVTVVNSVKDSSDIFILGPSSIMYYDFLMMYHIKMIFGMTYTKDDDSLLEIIKSGHGTPAFKKLANKVFIIK